MHGLILAATGGNAQIDEAVEAGFGQLNSTLTGVLVPALFGLVVLGVVIALAVKYIRRGAQKA